MGGLGSGESKLQPHGKKMVVAGRPFNQEVLEYNELPHFVVLSNIHTVHTYNS